MQFLTIKRAAAAAFMLVLIAGCNNKTEQSAPAVPSGTSVAAPKEPAATSRDQAAYYSQNLEEARATWHQCLEAKFSELTDEQRARCAAAQSAWETQPYKARDRK